MVEMFPVLRKKRGGFGETREFERWARSIARHWKIKAHHFNVGTTSWCASTIEGGMRCISLTPGVISPTKIVGVVALPF
jgi:hypothetical protein